MAKGRTTKEDLESSFAEVYLETNGNLAEACRRTGLGTETINKGYVRAAIWRTSLLMIARLRTLADDFNPAYGKSGPRTIQNKTTSAADVPPVIDFSP
jgi:hypothetical protein